MSFWFNWGNWSFKNFNCDDIIVGNVVIVFYVYVYLVYNVIFICYVKVVIRGVEKLLCCFS